MAKKQKKPEAKKSNREDVIFVRLSEDEKAQVAERASQLGLGEGPFARMMLLKGQLPVED